MSNLFEMVKGCKRIEIDDFRDFVPGKDANGGQYAYFYEFKNIGNGFIVRYSTTAEFEFCEKYGNYQSCRKCMYFDVEGWECTAPDEIWSLKDLLTFIEKNINDKDFKVFVDDTNITAFFYNKN